MRIVCPRCSSDYNIPDTAIPADGRDVQCSECGHSWYLLPLRNADVGEALENERAEDGAGASSERRAARLREVLDTHRRAPREEPQAPVDEIEFAGKEAADSLPAPPSRQLAPEMLSVLREEADRESRARHGGTVSLETQPDLGLEDPAHRHGTGASGVRDRLARLQAAERVQSESSWQSGEETFPDPAALGATLAPRPSGLRRNATPRRKERSKKQASQPKPEPGLPAIAEPRALAVIEQARARRGFRVGFTVPVALACGALVLYLTAPWFGEQVPQTAGVMEAVTEGGDTVRTLVATQLKTALQAVSDIQQTDG